VDYAKGICMIGVVSLYAVNRLGTTGDGGWMQAWADFAKPFRMPDFFLLSGLFLGRVIDRPWRTFLDKKVAHYLYFFVLWSSVFFAARLVAFRIGLFHGQEDAGPLWYKLLEPYAMLWFIQLLPVFFVAARILKPVPVWLLLLGAALLQMFPVSWEKWSLVRHFCERFVFFLAGYCLAHWFFRLAQWCRDNRAWALFLLALWAVVNGSLVRVGWSELPGVSLFLGLAGAAGVIAAAALLMDARGTDWLRYLGRHSLVIYVGFYLPMLTAIAFIRRYIPPLDISTASAMISVLSAFAALSMFWITRNTILKLFFVRPSWARIGR
jgi:uncharacterized membrane protein YcfT